MSAIGRFPRFWHLTGLILLAAPAFAQDAKLPTIHNIPPIERNADDFYHAIAGTQAVQVEWLAGPTRVLLNGDIALSLVVRHAVNPAELIRPDLRKFPVFIERFQILDTESAPTTAPNEVRFTYQLRPRTLGETEIPSLKYLYFRPAYPPGKRLQTTRTRPVPITVIAPPPKPAVSIVAPDEFFALVPMESTPSPFGWQSWLMPIPLSLLATGVGWIAWRFLVPSSARRTRLRQSRAARTALARLRSRNLDADAVFTVVHDYLVSRWDLPSDARTPRELAARLPDAIADSAGEFAKICDAARFAGVSDNAMSLVELAREQIASWEGGAT